MADDRPLVEQILDVALFAPIGAVATATEQVPALVAKGRATFERRVTLARMVGRVAVSTARRKVSDVVDSQTKPPAERGRATGARRPDVAPPDGVTSEPAAPAPAVESLAIPGYDALAASQVVQRLEGLSPGELEQVRRYELATRGRRTILGRIAQLQGDGDAGG